MSESEPLMGGRIALQQMEETPMSTGARAYDLQSAGESLPWGKHCAFSVIWLVTLENAGPR